MELLNNNNILVYILKNLVIILCTFYTNLKILNIKIEFKLIDIIKFIIVTFVIIISYKFLEKVINFNINNLIYIVCIISISFSIKTNISIGHSLISSIISLSINEILFFIGIVFGYALYKLINIDNENINFFIIIILYIGLLNLFFKIKRIKNGISFLNKSINDEYINLLNLIISLIILFVITMISNYNRPLAETVIPALVIFSIIMIISIQKSLQLYYKQRMLVKDLEETKKELEEKKAEVKELEKENLNFSKISHTIAHRQKVLEHKLEELNMNSEISNEIGARIEDVTKDLRKETPVELSKTGISVIDDMLLYMQSECIKNNIDFQLQLNGNIYTMTNHYVGKDELEILLADHIKDAIIAIGYVENVNKSILVRLGKIDGIYSLYIYDSGIEFEIDTFMNLGIKPSTTHKDNGGTGMGFMNTFDTLRKYKASLEIDEIGKPCKDNFTKVLKFKFDNKEEFTIKSYRKDEIKKKDKENKLNLI